MTDENQKYISPERLDELLRVTNPEGWIALVGLCFLIICIFVWLFLGKIPTQVIGTGMLINIGGIHTITSDSNGRIERFDIKIGDTVSQNQPVAYIMQSELLNEIQNIDAKRKEQIITNHERESIREELAIKYAEEVLALKKKLDAELKLLKSGVTLEREALDTKEKLTETNRKLEELKIDKLNDENSLRSLERELKSLQDKYDLNNIVRSPYKGVVIELKETVGSVVKPGSQLLTLETIDNTSHQLLGIIYISALDGKRVTTGMGVHVIPSTIKPEEYGSMIGSIAYVSQYPATLQGMTRILQNEEMAKQILSKGSQVEVHLNLQQSQNTISGFQWTSKDGPPLKIQSGTLCEARITVKEKHPIELIIPKIKEWLGTET